MELFFGLIFGLAMVIQHNLPNFRMPKLYSFCFEFQEEPIRVSFYDSKYDIINAESLGQVDHYSRRKWALKMIDSFNHENIVQIEIQSDESDGNLFSKRLVEENWTPF